MNFYDYDNKEVFNCKLILYWIYVFYKWKDFYMIK